MLVVAMLMLVPVVTMVAVIVMGNLIGGQGRASLSGVGKRTTICNFLNCHDEELRRYLRYVRTMSINSAAPSARAGCVRASSATCWRT